MYECLDRWRRSEPGLIQRLVSAVESAGVAEPDAQPEVTLDDVETAEQAESVS